MKIGEIAELSGTTVRAIRHYHQLGVLPEPTRSPGGYREYGVTDLVRVMRIVFLAGSGIPLREIPALLDATGDELAAGISSLRQGIDEQIESLIRQRTRLDLIAERSTDGLSLGILPRPIARALEACQQQIPGEPELKVLLDREREMLELLALSASIPQALIDAYAAIESDPTRRATYLGVLREFHEIEGRPIAEVDNAINRIVSTLCSDATMRDLISTPAVDSPAIDSHEVDYSSTAVQRPDIRPEHSALNETDLIPDPTQREVIRRTLAALTSNRLPQGESQ